MGILDRFFKGKKEISKVVEAELEKDEASTKAPSDELIGTANADMIRAEAKQYLPGDIVSLYSHRQMLKNVISSLGFSETLIEEMEKVFTKVKTGEFTLLQSSAVVANNINKIIESSDTSDAERRLCEGDRCNLLKTWVVLDYYASTLKSEFGQGIRRTRDRLSACIVEKGLADESTSLQKEIYDLEKMCSELRKIHDKADELKKKRQQLSKLLLQKDGLFVLYDEDFNASFPFVALDGRMEVCTRYETAVSLKKHYEIEHMGHITVKRLENSDFEKMLRAMSHMGIGLSRLDNGISPCDIVSSEVTECKEENLVERFNCGLRGMFLRSLQYDRRLSGTGGEIKGTPKEKAMLEALLTSRFNGYREFGNSICYVFANPPYEKGTTLYSKNALDRAKKLCSAIKLDESSLISPLDTRYDTYKGGMNFRVTRKSENDAMENSLICVFTSRYEAEKARLHFEKYGCNDSVVAVTYEEIASQVSGCAGIKVDMSSYGLEIRKKEFDEIKKWRGVKGRIAVNLKKKEDAEDKAPLEPENTK